jgi:hypothetical protein
MEIDLGSLARAGVRGVVAAMAMTGFRTMAGNAGLLDEAPPEAIVKRRVPRLIRWRAPRKSTAFTELAHWAYGAAGGAVLGLLPREVRGHPATGPVYGLALWVLFEAGIAPLLDVPHNRQKKVVGRLMVAADHVLYGVIAAGRLAPEPKQRPTTVGTPTAVVGIDPQYGRRGISSHSTR